LSLTKMGMDRGHGKKSCLLFLRKTPKRPCKKTTKKQETKKKEAPKNRRKGKRKKERMEEESKDGDVKIQDSYDMRRANEPTKARSELREWKRRIAAQKGIEEGIRRREGNVSIEWKHKEEAKIREVKRTETDEVSKARPKDSALDLCDSIRRSMGSTRSRKPRFVKSKKTETDEVSKARPKDSALDLCDSIRRSIQWTEGRRSRRDRDQESK